MLICRIEGHATSTICHPSLKGWRMLVCQPVSESGEAQGNPVLSLDNLGAGMHQTVVLTSDGKSVREKLKDMNSPARYMTIAILDEQDGKVVPA